MNPYLMVSEVAKQQGQSCAREDEANAVADAANQQLTSMGRPLDQKPQTIKFFDNPNLPGLQGKGNSKSRPEIKASFDCQVMSR